MYIKHDLFAAGVANFISNLSFIKIKQTVIDCWPRSSIATEYVAYDIYSDGQRLPSGIKPTTMDVDGDIPLLTSVEYEPVVGTEVEIFNKRNYMYARGQERWDTVGQPEKYDPNYVGTIENDTPFIASNECAMKEFENFSKLGGPTRETIAGTKLYEEEYIQYIPEVGSDEYNAPAKTNRMVMTGIWTLEQYWEHSAVKTHKNTVQHWEDGQEGLGNVDFIWWQLNPVSALDVTEEDVANYINDNSTLFDVAMLSKITIAKGRARYIDAWRKEEDYLENGIPENIPEEYQANWPTTVTEIIEERNLLEIDMWNEIELTFIDTPVATLNFLTKNNNFLYTNDEEPRIITPEPYDTESIKTLLLSGYFATLEANPEWEANPTEVSILNGGVVDKAGLDRWVADTAYENGSIRLNKYNSNGIDFAVIAQGGNNSGFGAGELFEIEIGLKSSYMTKVQGKSTQSVTRWIDYTDNPDGESKWKLVHPDTYVRSARFVIKYRRVQEATSTHNTVIAATALLNQRYTSTSESVGKKLLDDARENILGYNIQETDIVRLPYSGAITNLVTTEDGIEVVREILAYYKVAAIENMSPREFTEMIAKSLTIEFEKKNVSTGESLLNFVIVAVVFIVSVYFATYTGGKSLSLAQALTQVSFRLGMAAMLISGVVKLLADSGYYALASSLNTLSSIMSTMSTILGVMSLIISYATTISNAANTSKDTAIASSTGDGGWGMQTTEMQMSTSPGIGDYTKGTIDTFLGTSTTTTASMSFTEAVSYYTGELIDYGMEYLTEGFTDVYAGIQSGSVTEIFQGLNKITGLMRNANNIYWTYVNPLPEVRAIPELEENSDPNPYAGISYDMFYQTDPYNNIFDTNAPIEQSYTVMSADYMCQFVGKKYEILPQVTYM